MTKSKGKYFLSGIASFVIWGFFAIPLRNLKGFPATEILYYRIFISLILIWASIFLFRKSQLKKDIASVKSLSTKEKSKFIWLTIISTFLVTANWYTFIYAINNVSIKSGAFAYMVCPLITALSGYLFLKEDLSKLKLTALGVAFASIFLLATGSFVETIWSIGIAALYAFYLVIQRVINHVDKFNFLGVQLILSVIIMLPMYLSNWHPAPNVPTFWIITFVISVLFTIVPLFLSLYALLGIPSSTLGIMMYLNPIIAFAIAFLYFNEKIEIHQVFAYSLLLFAVALFNWGTIKGLLFKRI